jgi:hypothetical protein
MQVILANGSFERAVEALEWSPTILSHSFKRRVSDYWVAILVLLWWGTAFGAGCRQDRACYFGNGDQNISTLMSLMRLCGGSLLHSKEPRWKEVWRHRPHNNRPGLTPRGRHYPSTITNLTCTLSVSLSCECWSTGFLSKTI